MPKPDPSANTPRFYCPSLSGPGEAEVSDPLCALDKAESHHARSVLRLSVGDAVWLFDGQGAQADAHIEQFQGSQTICRIGSISKQPRPAPQLTVATAIPKGPRADSMVDQLSQLAVDVMIPLRTEHSVALPKDTKLEKFRRAAIESAKQCGRSWLMQVDEPQAPDALWADAAYDLKLLAVPGAGGQVNLADRVRGVERVLVLIGPEGGWGERELASADEHGCDLWTFAPHVLRIETAAIAAAAILRTAPTT